MGQDSRGRPRRGTFASLAVPVYRAWFISQILSASGLMTQSVGNAWLVLQLTGRAVNLALLSGATLLPVLLAGAWGGSLADRVDRRRLLIATQAGLAAIAGTLSVLSATGQARLWTLLLLAACAGGIGAIDGPARQVYVMDLVGRERLASAVGLYEVILNASRVLGPALGGLLLAVSGPTACFAANAVSYLPPLWVVWRHRPVRQDRGSRAERARGSARQGLRYVASSPVLRVCVVMAAASGVLFNASVLFPMLATRALRMGGGGYGALLACFGLGALPGAIWAARRGEPRGSHVCYLGLSTGLVMAATGYAPSPPWAFAGIAVTGFTSIWFIAAANTLVQLRADPDFRGRTMGVWTMALPGLSPVTGLLVALLADGWGARPAFATGGAAIAVAAAVGWPVLHRDAGRVAPPVPAEQPA